MSVRILTELDDNSSITLTVGDEIKIELESNPGTGYEWIPEDKSVQHFDNIHTDYKPLSEVSAPGSAELSIINLQAKIESEGEVILHYIQPWNPTEIERTFKIKYLIKDKA